MKPIKKWLAQDDGGQCYIYNIKPKYKDGVYYTKHFPKGMVGMFVLCGLKSQVPTVECIVMTKEDYIQLKQRKPMTSNIAPTKMWLAQDDSGMSCLHHENPKYNNGKYTTKRYSAGLIGMWLINSDVDYVECIVMTNEDYEKLKEKKPRASKET